MKTRDFLPRAGAATLAFAGLGAGAAIAFVGDNSDAARLREAAATELGLVRTGGSDWHGTWHGKLGDYAVDSANTPEFVQLLQR